MIMIKTVGEILESLRYFEFLKLKEFDYILGLCKVTKDSARAALT